MLFMMWWVGLLISAYQDQEAHLVQEQGTFSDTFEHALKHDVCVLSQLWIKYLMAEVACYVDKPFCSSVA